MVEEQHQFFNLVRVVFERTLVVHEGEVLLLLGSVMNF